MARRFEIIEPGQTVRSGDQVWCDSTRAWLVVGFQTVAMKDGKKYRRELPPDPDAVLTDEEWRDKYGRNPNGTGVCRNGTEVIAPTW